jgi:ABC-type antimicrobial peptide transport system permease subunit
VAARFVAGSLAHVSASDPVTIGGAMLVLVSVALIAGWVPAHRASRIDPLASLRQE